MNKIEDCKVYSLNLKSIIIGEEKEEDKTNGPNIIDFIFGCIYNTFDYVMQFLGYSKDDNDLIKKCVCYKSSNSNCLSKDDKINTCSMNSQNCQKSMECPKSNETPKCKCELLCSCSILNKSNHGNKSSPNICNCHNFENCSMENGCETTYIKACDDLIDKTFAKLLNPVTKQCDVNKCYTHLDEVCYKLSYIVNKICDIVEKYPNQNNCGDTIECNNTNSTISINPCEELSAESLTNKCNVTNSVDLCVQECFQNEDDVTSSNNVSIESLPTIAQNIPTTEFQNVMLSCYAYNKDLFDNTNIVEPNSCNNILEFLEPLSEMETKCKNIKQNDSLFILHELTKSINHNESIKANSIPENTVYRMKDTPNKLKEELLSFDNYKSIQSPQLENKIVNKSIFQVTNNHSEESEINYYNDFIFNINERLKQNELKIKTENIKGCCNYN